MPKKKKKKKGGGKKRNKGGGGKGSNNHAGGGGNNDAAASLPQWTVKKDIERCEKICPDCWLAFTIAKAPWYRFAVDPNIAGAFSAPMGTNEASVLAWVKRAEAALSGWVLSDLILKENHMEQ